MTNHSITKDYRQLRGFSTDSIFKRPAFVADTVVNMMRLPDGTFSPRRGYQAQTNGKGGLGTATYRNHLTDEVEQVCIAYDGNLYRKRSGTLEISFAGADKYEYVAYRIYVDPLVSSDVGPSLLDGVQDAFFDPFSVVNQYALVTDSINFQFGKVTSFSGVSVGAGSASYSGNLGGGEIQPGSITMTDGTLTINDVPSGDGITGTFEGDIGIGPTSINYITGNYAVVFSGVTGAVTASYRTVLLNQFDQAMGIGYNASTPFLISQLILMLSSTPGVSVVATGNTFTPGAFLEVSEQVIIPDGKSATLNFYWMEKVNATVASPFSGLVASLSTDAFINATFAAFKDVVYIANAFDPVQKYDGQTVYRAGMPNGVAPTLANGGGGNVDTGTHLYRMQYQFYDATGRLVEGVISKPTSITLGGASIVNVTVANLVAGSGWNTNGAIVNGAQVGVNTIVVDSGHTMKVGDMAFFIDGAGNEQTREVEAITATSITIDGTPVTVDDNAVISNRLAINIYRTKAVGGGEYFFVARIANNSFSATTVYADDTADADIGPQFFSPKTRHDPPPQVAVAYAYDNVMIYTADPNNKDAVWYSDPDAPEYVGQEADPQGTIAVNAFFVPSNDDNVIGCGSAGTTLVIFKNRSIYAVSGEISTEENFTAIPIAQGKGIGCVAHATIVSVAGLLYFLHTNGIYSISEINLFPTDDLGNPIPLTIPIDQFFRQVVSLQLDKQFVLKRAVAVDYTKDNQYLLFLPCEDQGGVRAANENSRVLSYDYQGKNFFQWTNINAAGGFFVQEDNLFWQSRVVCVACGIKSQTFKQHRKYRLIDYVDHVAPIRVTWISSWEDFGQPRVRKKFIRAALLFDNISSLYQTNIPVMFFFTCTDWNAGIFDTMGFVTTDIEGNPWNLSPWDWTEWSGYQDTFFTVPLRAGTVTKSLQLGLQLKQLNTSFNLQGFQMEISPDFGRVIVR